MTTINANTEPLNETVLSNTALWYLKNEDHLLSYNRVTIQPIYEAPGKRLGGKSGMLSQIKDPEPLPLYRVSECGPFAGFLLYVGRNHTNFGYKGSNNTGDGTFAVFYDINQNFLRTDYIPTPPEGSDGRYHYSKNFPIDENVHFILFGGYDASFEVEELTIE